MKSRARAIALAALSLALSAPANAWDGTVQGKIVLIELAEQKENLGFRVYLEGGPPLCGNSYTWAYVDGSASNYQALAATLTSIWLAGRTATLFTVRDAENHCRIGHVYGS